VLREGSRGGLNASHPDSSKSFDQGLAARSGTKCITLSSSESYGAVLFFFFSGDVGDFRSELDHYDAKIAMDLNHSRTFSSHCRDLGGRRAYRVGSLEYMYKSQMEESSCEEVRRDLLSRRGGTPTS
jgi:hypothetical protein